MAASDDLSGYPDGTPLDETDRHLAAVDPAMRDLIRRWGPVGELAPHDAGGDGFGALILAIVSQQFSTAAARRMFDRITGRFGGRVPSAAALLAADLDQLRVAAGLSHAKTRALRSLAEHVETGALELDRLPELPDDEVRRQLTAVSGVGEWTAGVFLVFSLHRPDVLLANDLGIRKAVQAQYGLAGPPDAATVTRLGEPWRPYRTRACLYLWRSLETAPIPVRG
ncbi:DNA-3-methyladenine glycosylase family protein [Actinoplanes sp. NPDC051513]|uniref:DNA-3-methyladenine glycosylase family protein n=1 Tax=Actinoplanes sp. NPDC051513 TaxID=3363908 RepID=UPI0037A84608